MRKIIFLGLFLFSGIICFGQSMYPKDTIACDSTIIIQRWMSPNSEEDLHYNSFNIMFTKNTPVEYELMIFDRWGNVVFQTKDYKKDWDGRIQNKNNDLAQPDNYIWKIKCRYSLKDTVHTCIGTFALTSW